MRVSEALPNRADGSFVVVGIMNHHSRHQTAQQSLKASKDVILLKLRST